MTNAPADFAFAADRTLDRSAHRYQDFAATYQILRQHGVDGIAHFCGVGGYGIAETNPKGLPSRQLIACRRRYGRTEQREKCEPAHRSEQDSHAIESPSHIRITRRFHDT